MPYKLQGVLVLHNLPRHRGAGAQREFVESDASVMEQVQAVTAALGRRHIPFRSVGVAELEDLPRILEDTAEPVVFNLVESFHHHAPDAMLVPGICKAHNKFCTGNDTPCTMLSLDKWRTKAVLQAAGLPVPAGVLVHPGEPIPRRGLFPGPYIVKPAWADASEGIDDRSVVKRGLPALRRVVARVHQDHSQPALIEQYFGDRELNVALLQRGDDVQVLAVAEIDFSAFGPRRPRIVGYAAKWLPHSFEYSHTPRVVPARISAAVAGRVRAAALAAWHVMGCHDYTRVDFRLDARGQIAILEINPNPDISPASGYSAALADAGISYEEFVDTLLRNAMARRRASAVAQPRFRKRQPRKDPTQAIRPSQPGDRAEILRFMEETRFFRPSEMDIAREVLDDALTRGPGSHYRSFVYEDDGQPAGWICFGSTACTIGTYDIYWIAVAPNRQGRGIGRALLAYAEDVIRERRGRLIIIETSGRPIYMSTRGFYLAVGYQEAARLRDFYASGDDKIVYSKHVNVEEARAKS